MQRRRRRRPGGEPAPSVTEDLREAARLFRVAEQGVAVRFAVKFPIRMKIMLGLVLVVTAVVGTIGYAMARLFDEHRQAHIHALVSTVARSVADETRSLVEGYHARTLAYAQRLDDPDLPGADRDALMRDLFTEFPQLISLHAFSGGGDVVFSAHNRRALEVAGVDPDALVDALAAATPGWALGERSDAHIVNFTIEPALPMLALAVAPSGADPGNRLRVTSLISLAQLSAVARRAGGWELFVADRDGVLLAHSESMRTARREKIEPGPWMARLKQSSSTGLAMEFDRSGEAIAGGYALVGFADLVAAAQIPSRAAFPAPPAPLQPLLGFGLALLAAATLVGLVWARRLTRRLKRLADAAGVVAAGVFDVRVDVESRDELGDLEQAFNRMAGDLKQRAGKLDQAQAQLVQSARLAAFGQLGAGIAHEVRNPLAGILGCAQLSLRAVEREGPVFENLALIEKETKRCKEIIENLMLFALQEKAVHEPVDLNTVVGEALSVVKHSMELDGIRLRSSLAEGLPPIHGSANRLRQVLVNLLINARQAMAGEAGTIEVTTGRGQNGTVITSVKDTGPGIPRENQVKLFEPFFTTKPGGKGTGLGLSVSFGIIQDHRGTIRVESEVGHGATFIIELPPLSPPERSATREIGGVLAGVR